MQWKNFFSFSFWHTSILGNTLDTYLLSVGVFLAMIAGFYLLKRFVLRRVVSWSKRTKSQWDDAVVQAFRGIGNGFYGYISLYVAVQFLILPEDIRRVLYWGLMVLIIFRATYAIQVCVDFLARKHMQSGKTSRPAMSLVSTLLRICVWVVALMVVLSNLGVNVTSLAAGLGIGGIAVALAAQNILSDLFSYFTLHFDKPVKEGDTIMFENTLGTVEKIGLKTTRIKTQRGEQMVVPNKDVTAKLLFNFEHLKERRELFTQKRLRRQRCAA